jgi:hypothetical protein
MKLSVPKLSDFINKTFWIPAFAGMTPLGKQGLTSFYVIPAEAGIQYFKNQLSHST